MSFTPQQNWPAYRLLVESQQIENNRSRSAIQTYKRYSQIFNHVRAVKSEGQPMRSSKQLEKKMMLRAKLLVACRLVTVPADK